VGVALRFNGSEGRPTYAPAERRLLAVLRLMVMHSITTDGEECVQMPGKMADLPSPPPLGLPEVTTAVRAAAACLFRDRRKSPKYMPKLGISGVL